MLDFGKTKKKKEDRIDANEYSQIAYRFHALDIYDLRKSISFPVSRAGGAIV